MTSATAQAWPDGASLPARLRLRYRAWRRTRPFWGGLLAIYAGIPILYFPYAHLTLGGLTVAMSTTAGAGSLLIGVLMIMLGVAAWFQPATRVFCGVAVSILTLISIPVSNLGGFGIGLILGLISGGLLCSWAPLKVDEAALAAASAAFETPPAEPETGELLAGFEQPAAVEQPAGPKHAAPEAGVPGTGPAEQAGEAK